MNNTTAKTELLTNHFHHALHELVGHFQELGDLEALVDLQLLVETFINAALARTKPTRRVGQPCGCDHQCDCLG